MARKYVFADEAGNFHFKVAPGASRYFIIGTVTLRDPSIGTGLLELRRELAWQGVALESSFHASEDPQVVRDEVFRLLDGADFRVDATVLDKRKTEPHLQNYERFYKMAWFLHFKYVAPRVITSGDELLVVAASVGTKKRRRAMRLGIADVVDQATWRRRCTWEVAFWPAESDPCLQIADYCTWAIQRKWESDDERSYGLIADQIATEFPIFRVGTKYYY